MTSTRILCAAGAVVASVAIIAMVGNPGRVKANNDPGTAGERIQAGFAIAPVPLKMEGRDWRAVGLGSYLVNAMGSCNDCHSAGPQTQYLKGENPYFGQPAMTNPETYLGGGREFGQIAGPNSPDIISRNLTPDKSGLPIGGHTFEQFRTILRTGQDLDHLHPNCSATVASDCLPPIASPSFRFRCFR